MGVKNILEFDSLFLEFGMNRVLQDVYVKCEQGQVVGLLGRNGSGKSCLMKIVFGSLKAYQQSVRINGEYLLETNIRKGLIHYLPQESFIPPFLTIRKVLYQYQLSADQFVGTFPDFAGRLGSKITELSGGEVRLLEIFVILNREGLFCVLDEPFSNLMPLHIEKVIALIREARLQKGIILTDHMYRYLLKTTDLIYLLSNGKTYPVSNNDQLVQFGYLSFNPE
jgi:ABC-type multidrug transport system ATPase subunit